jgi:hypothetical protein
MIPSPMTPLPAFDPRRIQCVLVGMLFDPEYAARVLGDAPMPELGDRERALLRSVDPRALGADPFRRARAVTTLLDEYPVTAAVLGLGTIERFFATDDFRRAVSERGSMAVAFGAWVGERAHGIGRLEAAMAVLRRAGPSPAAAAASNAEVLCVPARLRAIVVPAGTLAYHTRALQQLGPDVAAALAGPSSHSAERPPRRGAEYLLVERRDDGSIDLGTGSAALVKLLVFGHAPRTREALGAEAVRLGAEPGEAHEIIDDLCAQGLLRRA